MWEDLTARAGLLDRISQNIVFHASGCVALVEAVAERKVNAAFGWSAFQHLAPDRIEVTMLRPEEEIWRATCVGLLTFCRHREEASQFMDFLASDEGRCFYEEYGWVVPKP